jgi:hypothetical protein
MRRPEVLDLPRARCDDHTTRTVGASDFVFTVRTYGISQLYGPPLVRNFSFKKRKSAAHSLAPTATAESWPKSGLMSLRLLVSRSRRR